MDTKRPYSLNLKNQEKKGESHLVKEIVDKLDSINKISDQQCKVTFHREKLEYLQKMKQLFKKLPKDLKVNQKNISVLVDLMELNSKQEDRYDKLSEDTINIFREIGNILRKKALKRDPLNEFEEEVLLKGSLKKFKLN